MCSSKECGHFCSCEGWFKGFKDFIYQKYKRWLK
jgi:hypothetical protein